MKRILSRANPRFKSLRALKDSARERRTQGQTLLDGPHLVRAYLEAIGQPVLVAVSADAVTRPEIAQLLGVLDATEVCCFPAPLYAQIAPVGSATGILALIDIPKPGSFAHAEQFVILLDRIQDPGNVGTIIRSAAGAGADAVLLCSGCADPWSPRALRAAMGGTFALAVRTGADLVGFAEQFSGQVVATVGRGGVPPSAIDLTGPLALLLGSEGEGLSDVLESKAAVRVTIPLARAMESLNVGAAAAVVMFERVRQRASQNR